MKTWLRKLRGIVSIGAIWGLVSSVLGLALGAIDSWIYHEVVPITVLSYMVAKAILVGVEGFIIGSGFAGVLAMMEGRQTLDELTPARAALWGVLTGLLLMTGVGLVTTGLGSSLTLAQIVVGTCLSGTVSAGLAAGTVSLAKRAPAELGVGAEPQESKLLGGPDENIPRQFGPVWRKEQSGSSAP